VVSDIPSFRALTGGGAIGALARAGEPEAFARALVEMAGRPRTLRRQAVIDHFRRTLSFARVGRRLAEIYGLLAEARR
jgi:glycosyltransferase involved in cell wall biosynthesis